MHKEAEELETTLLLEERDGGIRQAGKLYFIGLTLVGAIKVAAKEESTHSTKFNLLKD